MDLHPIKLSRRLEPRHSVPFCVRAHPIICRLAQELETKGSISRTLALNGIDELEVVLAQDPSKCLCKRAIAVLVQAGNLKKWMKLLFNDHENRFKKYGVPFPVEYVRIKEEITSLINKLQYNFIMSTYKMRNMTLDCPSPKKRIIRKDRKRQIKPKPESHPPAKQNKTK